MFVRLRAPLNLANALSRLDLNPISISDHEFANNNNNDKANQVALRQRLLIDLSSFAKVLEGLMRYQ